MKIFKCVGHQQLENETRNGWTMEQVLVHDHATTVNHTAPAQVVNQNNSNSGYYSSSPGISVPVESPIIVREPMFLLSKDSEVESRESQLQSMLNGEMANHKKSLEQYDVLKKAHDTYKGEADLRTKQLGESAGVQQRLHEEKRKLEGDLAKVQKAIGDLKYFEIVGGPIPK
jgi:hypothetical protein